TSLTVSPASTRPGQAVTFTATVTPYYGSTATPTGEVYFYDTVGSQQTFLGAAALSAGTAAFTTSTLSTGTHQIVAQYLGTAAFMSSSSYAVTETVGLTPV